MYFCTRGTEAFAHSLRKYPSLSPVRSTSADLVCKLLAHTQAKNAVKSSKHVRSARLPREKTSEPVDVQERLTKNIQTLALTKEIIGNDDKCLQQPRTKRMKVLSSLNERTVRYKDNQLNESYDYLKCTSPRRYAKSPEVRYLNEVTRYLKDTIRQICDDDTNVCPQIQSRYSRHQREHHKRCAAQQSSSTTNGVEAQASEHTVSHELPLMSCAAKPRTSDLICSSYPKICCYCKNPMPCACNPNIPAVFSNVKPTPKTLEKTYSIIDYGKLKRIINDWLQEVPVYANISLEDIVKREEMLENLANRLNELKNEEAFEKNAKLEIRKCMDILPMWSPGDENEKNDFKEKFVDDLVNRLQNFHIKAWLRDHKNRTEINSKDEDKFDNEIWKWLDDIDFKTRNSHEDVVNKSKIMEIFVKRLKPLHVSDYHDELKNEIVNILDELPIKFEGNKSDFIDKLANKLINKLKRIPKSEIMESSRVSIDSLENNFQQQIFNWLEDVPELSSDSISHIEENNKLVEKLAKKLHQIQIQGNEDKIIQENMRDVINNWLESFVKKKCAYFDRTIKNKLSENLTKKLVNSVKSSLQKKTSADDDSKQIIIQEIGDCLEDIPELCISNKFENKKMIEMLASKLQKVDDHEELQNEISKWLELIAKKKETHLDPKIHKNLTDKLSNNIKNIRNKKQRRNISDDNRFLIKKIWSCLENIPEIVNTAENNNMVQQLARKIIKLKAQDADITSQEEMQNEIEHFLENIYNKNGVNISNIKNELANKLMSQIEYMPKQQRKRWSKQDKDNDQIILDSSSKKKATENKTSNVLALKQSLKVGVSEILDRCRVRLPNQSEVESDLINVLADQVMREGDVNTARQQISNILQEANISEDEVQNISNRLIDSAKELSFKNYDSTSRLGSTSSQETVLTSGITPIQKQIFQDSAERQIFDFIEEITGNDNRIDKNKIKHVTERLANKLGDVISDSERTPEEKDIAIRSEISQFLDNLPLKSKIPQAELVTQLSNRLQSIDFKTSTPRVSVDRKMSFYPKKDTIGLSISSINNNDEDDYQFANKSQTNVEKEYMLELINEIKKWISEFDSYLDDNKGFKETMVNDLAGDIIDRRKYLQLNPEAKVSDYEELENLKYQVFRWLNKILDINDLSEIITKTDNLMELISNIPIPQLAKPVGKRQEIKLTEGILPNYRDVLQDEISLWFENMSSLVNSTEESLHQEIIKELAERLEQVLKNGNIDMDLDNEISKWLSSVMSKKVSKNNLSKMKESLKNRLRNKGLTDKSSWILKQNSSQFVVENLTGGILDWLKSLPLYQKRNSQEKRIQENLVPELAKGLKRVFESVHAAETDENADELFIKEIIKHLQKFPIEKEHKANEYYIRKISEELLRHLKDLRMFYEISDRELHSSRATSDLFSTNVENWINSLPLKNKITTTEKAEFDKLKKEFIEQLKRLWQQYQKYEQVIKEVIKSNLLKFPIEASKKKNQNFVIDKVEQLIKDLLALPLRTHQLSSLSEVGSNASDTPAYKKAADILYDNIENWCENIPIADGDTPEEIERIKTLKQQIASKLINKIGELNMNPEIFNDDMLYEDIIQDEIQSLLSTLPMSPELQSNLSALKGNLLEKLKEALQKHRDELAGQTYKQLLREAISKTIPSLKNLSSEEQASFEILKDSLANAYINLHYVSGNDGLKTKYKNKIAEEINRFCNNYLKRHPATPVDSKKLNQDIFHALCKVPIPKDETIRSEVEKVRIKDEINEWINELPLKECSGPELLRRNKVANILAKRLHDIEKEKQMRPEVDYDNKMRKEIIKWLKKLPIKAGEENSVEELLNKLTNNLKSTEQSRRITESLTRQSIDVEVENEEPANQSHNQVLETPRIAAQIPSNNSHLCRSAPHFPSSALSTEDKSYMQRIRDRNIMPSCLTSPPLLNCKDVGVSPLPIDVASQTQLELGSSDLAISNKTVTSCTERSKEQNYLSQAVSASNEAPCMEAIGSQIDISPQIIVKEYFWDSTSNMHGSGYRFPCMPFTEPCSSKQRYGPPCASPSQSPCAPLESSCAASQSQFLSPGPCIVLPSPCVIPEPSIRKAPCVSAQQQTSSCQSQQPYSQPISPQSDNLPLGTTPKRVCRRQDHSVPFRQPNFKFAQASAHPSPTEYLEPGTSRSFRQKNVTHLSSLDDDQCSEGCKKHASKTKKSRRISEEDFEWSVRFPDDTEFWNSSSSRRKHYQIPSEDIKRPFTGERRGKEEKIRCRCRERILTTSMSRKAKCHHCQSCENLRQCSKCCGIHCPHPSGFYFR
ncbi:uncharacterized protein ACR2FA_009813 [Aphomia sociella]